jgi:hypothetical protein
VRWGYPLMVQADGNRLGRLKKTLGAVRKFLDVHAVNIPVTPHLHGCLAAIWNDMVLLICNARGSPARKHTRRPRKAEMSGNVSIPSALAGDC